MDTQELQTFVKVAEHLSFTRAARELSFAQSSVTAQVKRLEKEVGAPLFDRLVGGVRLTAEGERMLPFAREILELTARALQGDGESELLGTVVVGTMESIASYRLLPLVEYMHLRHPGLRLSMRPSMCNETADLIRQGVFDCGFFMDSGGEYPGLMVEQLAEERLVLVGAPGSPLVGRHGLTASDISQQRVLGTEQGCAYRDGLEQVLSGDGPEPFPILEFGTIDSTKRAVANGLGVALFPEVACINELADGALVELDWQPPFTIRSYVAWRKSQVVSPAIREIVMAARQIVSDDLTRRGA